MMMQLLRGSASRGAAGTGVIDDFRAAAGFTAESSRMLSHEQRPETGQFALAGRSGGAAAPRCCGTALILHFSLFSFFIVEKKVVAALHFILSLTGCLQMLS